METMIGYTISALLTREKLQLLLHHHCMLEHFHRGYEEVGNLKIFKHLKRKSKCKTSQKYLNPELF